MPDRGDLQHKDQCRHQGDDSVAELWIITLMAALVLVLQIAAVGVMILSPNSGSWRKVMESLRIRM